MKTFQNFQELIDYVPSCLICGKEMEIHFDGQLSWNHREQVHFKFQIKDGLLYSRKHKKYSVIIDPKTNLILEGVDLVNKLMTNWMSVYKTCWTCKFRIGTQYNKGNLKKQDTFPPLTLVSEELSYTLKRGKAVDIHQTYYDDSSLLGIRVWITVNHRPVKSLFVDFNKFKDLDQLNKRLSTIMTFS